MWSDAVGAAAATASASVATDGKQQRMQRTKEFTATPHDKITRGLRVQHVFLTDGRVLIAIL